MSGPLNELGAPLDFALIYAAGFDLAVFPCQARGPEYKHPLIRGGVHAASTRASDVAGWWGRWKDALIGVATGERSGVVVLEINRKNGVDGFNSLKELGIVIPTTPTVITPSGGRHLYLRTPNRPVPHTVGARGRRVGDGLDWRGEGDYVIAPAPGSGYEWQPGRELWTVQLGQVPEALSLREGPKDFPLEGIVEPSTIAVPTERYAEASLARACRAIVEAADGTQEATLKSESFSIGMLASAGKIDPDNALRTLVWAGCQMPSYRVREPWIPEVVERKVRKAFAAGMSWPRSAPNG